MNKLEVESTVEQYGNMVYRIAMIHCAGKKEDAEDVCQETFLALVRCRKHFESEEHLKAWLIRVALNQCKKKYNSNGKYVLMQLEEIKELRNDDTEVNMASSWLYEAVCQLPYKIRKVVELYYLEEMKTKEIAQILRISDASVRKRLERGRNMLREKGGLRISD